MRMESPKIRNYLLQEMTTMLSGNMLKFKSLTGNSHLEIWRAQSKTFQTVNVHFGEFFNVSFVHPYSCQWRSTNVSWFIFSWGKIFWYTFQWPKRDWLPLKVSLCYSISLCRLAWSLPLIKEWMKFLILNRPLFRLWVVCLVYQPQVV